MSTLTDIEILVIEDEPDLFTEAGSDGIPSILDDPSAAGGSVQELIDQIEGAR